MANRTDTLARAVRGTNPQYLIDAIVRGKIYETMFWKEECFGLTAESVCEKAADPKVLAGTVGGARAPSRFLCLLLKLLQIQPEKSIILEYITDPSFKFLRVLGAMYFRLVFPSEEVYKVLEPLLCDYRKVPFQDVSGQYSVLAVDEIVDRMLRESSLFDVALPRLTKREHLEQSERLQPRPTLAASPLANQAPAAGGAAGRDDDSDWGREKDRDRRRGSGRDRSRSRGRNGSGSSSSSSSRHRDSSRGRDGKDGRPGRRSRSRDRGGDDNRDRDRGRDRRRDSRSRSRSRSRSPDRERRRDRGDRRSRSPGYRRRSRSRSRSRDIRRSRDDRGRDRERDWHGSGSGGGGRGGSERDRNGDGDRSRGGDRGSDGGRRGDDDGGRGDRRDRSRERQRRSRSRGS